MNNISIVGNTLFKQLRNVSPSERKDLEAWVVNKVKVEMIRKLDNILAEAGRVNARKLFLVPLFQIKELTDRVEELAPEMKTLYFKELIETVAEAEKRLNC